MLLRFSFNPGIVARVNALKTSHLQLRFDSERNLRSPRWSCSLLEVGTS